VEKRFRSTFNGSAGGIVLADNQVVIPFEENSDQMQYVPDQFIIKLKSTAYQKSNPGSSGYAQIGSQSLEALSGRYGVVRMEEEFPGAADRPGGADLSRYRIVTFSGAHSLEEIISAYAADPNVESVERDRHSPVVRRRPQRLLLCGAG